MTVVSVDFKRKNEVEKTTDEVNAALALITSMCKDKPCNAIAIVAMIGGETITTWVGGDYFHMVGAIDQLKFNIQEKNSQHAKVLAP